MAVLISCLCGQSFTVHAGIEPTKVCCHMCGHKMLLNPRGDVIHLSVTKNERRREPAGPRSTAICEKRLSLSIDAIQAPMRSPSPREGAVTFEDADQVALEEELKRIELGWQIERLAYPTFSESGDSSLLRTWRVATWTLVFMIATVPIWAYLDWPGGYETLGLIEMVGALGVCITARSRERSEYEEAEARYNARRRAAIRRFSQASRDARH